LLLAAALLPAFAQGQVHPPGAVKTQAGKPLAPLIVHIVGLRSDKGQVGCLLFNGKKGFPQEGKIAYQGLWCPVAKRESFCRFGPIPAGVYAFGCFHDEDTNRELATGFMGIPSEGVVVSNEAKGFMGPPSYEDAAFKFSGKPTQVRLRMDY
jgi:uncharacterized protein (DUF2141 family)